MIRAESVITALMGGVIGIVLGLVLGGLLAARVDFIVFALPWVQVIIFALAAIIVGLLGGDLPGAPRIEAERARGAPVRVSGRRTADRGGARRPTLTGQRGIRALRRHHGATPERRTRRRPLPRPEGARGFVRTSRSPRSS
jgi:MFS family permease